MKQSITTMLNISEVVFAAYTSGGQEAFLMELKAYLIFLARKKSKNHIDIDRNFTILISGVLRLFLKDDGNKVLKEQTIIFKKCWGENDIDRKSKLILEAFTDFLIRFEKREMTLSEQILFHIKNAETDKLKEMTVISLAQEFGYSASHLSKKFKKEQGQNMLQAIQSGKLRRAFQLITQSPEVSCVQDLVYSLGFIDINYFRRSFKKKYGKSPFSLIKSRKDKKT